MKRFLGAFAVVLVLFASASGGVIDDLQNESVTIRAGSSQGSGVIVTRQIGNENVNFVWTAGHVIAHLRKTRQAIDTKTGTMKTVIEFDDAKIVQEYTQNGRRVGEVALDARVVRYSDADEGEDLALLEIRRHGSFPKEVTANFYLDEATPGLGTELYHVGSLLGQFGANSLTTGIVSQVGRVLRLGANGVVFDQISVNALGGSSGGGVFLKNDGRYVGMLVRGATSGDQFNFMVPVRRMKAWALRSNLFWAIDPNAPAPSVDELAAIPVEDSGLPSFKGEAGASTHDVEGLHFLIGDLRVPEGFKDRESKGDN